MCSDIGTSFRLKDQCYVVSILTALLNDKQMLKDGEGKKPL
jgi:hypothetical protein